MRALVQLGGLFIICATAVLLAGCVVITPFTSSNNELKTTVIQGKGNAEILWLPVTGFISGQPQSHAFGLMHEPSTLARVSSALDKAEQDNNIAAVILRIDSPGGSVSASDEIYARIQRFKKNNDVPVIASFGSLAASGAYYIAMGADHIIAQPTTVTGSIGVILLNFDASDLLHKLGISNESYVSGPNKDLLSPLKHDSPEQRRIMDGVIDHLYQRFVQVVRTNRPGLDSNQIDRITDGRVFTANQALKLGLVDAIGHIPAAIDAAKQRAGVSHARIIRYYRGKQPPRTLYAHASLAGSQAAAAQVNILPIKLGLEALDGPRMLYLWQPGS